MITYLNVPSVFQEDDYSCGPACINMLANYYKRCNKNGTEYSLSHIRKICNVDKITGTNYKDMNAALKHFGLKRVRCKNVNDIKKSLDNRYPVLTITPHTEEKNAAHYIIIRGYKKELDGTSSLLIADPFHRHYKQDQKYLMKQLEKEDNWIWSIRPA